MSVHADLHVHTTHSDGQMALDDVPAAARDAGVSTVAITDHDRVHPELTSPVHTRDGVTVIRGIELRVDPAALDERVDLLGYYVTPTPDLEAEIERLQADRASRAQRMIDRVEDSLDISLDIEGEAGMGRPDIARAIDDHPETEYDYEGAFAAVIGHDCPCYVSRDVTRFREGVELLSEACEIVGLAHPFRYDDPAAALELAADLDAVEQHYPYGADQRGETDLLEAVVDEYELVVTGGSDAHEYQLGRAGLSAVEFDRFRTAANRGSE